MIAYYTVMLPVLLAPRLQGGMSGIFPFELMSIKRYTERANALSGCQMQVLPRTDKNPESSLEACHGATSG